MDKTLLDPPENADNTAPSPMPTASNTPDNGNSQSSVQSDRAPATPKSEQGKLTKEMNVIIFYMYIFFC